MKETKSTCISMNSFVLMIESPKNHSKIYNEKHKGYNNWKDCLKNIRYPFLRKNIESRLGRNKKEWMECTFRAS